MGRVLGHCKLRGEKEWQLTDQIGFNNGLSVGLLGHRACSQDTDIHVDKTLINKTYK